ncbi:SdpI family protein [Ligilactobacillus sp. WILCCON 0076]|uniref:SdpI family protein n=1 Tax=Ligilactobacillus ubinensis TaxID=2876789 RepID=A0A9X2FK05_9LACO|nr:SdpI family protein [Ligilactobacillus ubinensis]MCP0887104.1 SdpI family protein [Ligilactobacillus ubinensis]
MIIYKLIFLFLVIEGIVRTFFPPQYTKLGNHWGYRTPTSKKNKENWYLGQKFSAIYSIITGLICFLILLRYNTSTVANILVVFEVISIIVFTELVLFIYEHFYKQNQHTIK